MERRRKRETEGFTLNKNDSGSLARVCGERQGFFFFLVVGFDGGNEKAWKILFFLRKIDWNQVLIRIKGVRFLFFFFFLTKIGQLPLVFVSSRRRVMAVYTRKPNSHPSAPPPAESN